MKKLGILGMMTILGSMAFGMDNGYVDSVYLRYGSPLHSEYSSLSTEKLGNGNVKVTDGKTDSRGYEIGIEATRNYNENIEYGIGFAYQDHAELEVYPKGVSANKFTGSSYSSMPIYLTGKYKFNNYKGFVPYVKADLGYSFNFGEENIKDNNQSKYSLSIKDGVYFGAGVGVEHRNFVTDIMYQINFADATYRGTSGPQAGKSFTGDMDYSRITWSIGYRFNL